MFCWGFWLVGVRWLLQRVDELDKCLNDTSMDDRRSIIYLRFHNKKKQTNQMHLEVYSHIFDYQVTFKMLFKKNISLTYKRNCLSFLLLYYNLKAMDGINVCLRFRNNYKQSCKVE